MKQQFRIDDEWLPQERMTLRVEMDEAASKRLAVSREAGWGRLLDLAGTLLGEPSDANLLHLLAALLLGDAQENGEARPARIARLLFEEEDRAHALLRRLTYNVPKPREGGWRLPMLRRLGRFLGSPARDELPWFDLADWFDLAERTEPSSNRDDADRCKLILERVPRAGMHRRLASLPMPADIAALAEEFPNFAPVAEHYAEQAAIARLGNGEVRLPPVLLLGEPGIGKTVFSQRLAEVFGVRHQAVAFAQATQGGQLGGLSNYWSNGRQGAVFDALLRGREMNPLFLLDEIDKAGADQRHDPLGSLYALLEPESARCFQDEFVELPVDASWFAWLATANDETVIPAPILSRMVAFEVRRPSPAELRRIGRAQYRQLIVRLGLDEHLPPEPPAGLLDKAANSPRELRLVLQAAIGRMARNLMEGRQADIGAEEIARSGRRQRRVGFV